MKNDVFMFNKKKSANFIAPILILAISSAITAALVFMLGDSFTFDALIRFFSGGTLFFWNFLPILLFAFLVYSLTSNIFISHLLGNGIFVLFAIASKYKILLRGDPIIPSDLLLGGEVTTIVTLDSFTLESEIVLILVCFFILSILLFFMKSPKVPLKIRIAGILFCLTIGFISYTTVYTNDSIIKSHPVIGDDYFSTDRYTSRGLVFSFFSELKYIKSVPIPDEYSAQNAENILKNFTSNEETHYIGKMPNIIAVMGESFYDFDKIPGVTFAGTENPLENYYEILKGSYHGNIITSAFGGGTANTEFSFLTGYNSFFFPQVTIYSTLVNQNMDSLPRYLKSLGYYTEAFHPGESWYYKRNEVFKYLGFDKSTFIEDITFPENDTRRDFLTDIATTKEILSIYESYINDKKTSENAAPYFSFTVTIENHGPYSDKVPYSNKEFFNTTKTLTPSTKRMINNYLYGLSESDKAIAYLVSQLKSSDEPVVLLYFGDHLPFLGNNFLVYNELDYNLGNTTDINSFLRTYSCPYLIWSNAAAKQLLSQNNARLYSQTTEKADDINASLLPLKLLEYVGLPKNDFFNFLTEVDNTLPVIAGPYYRTDIGYTKNISAAYAELINNYETLCYYKMFE